MPKLTIDGKEIEVPAGTNLLEAARGLDEIRPRRDLDLLAVDRQLWHSASNSARYFSM